MDEPMIQELLIDFNLLIIRKYIIKPTEVQFFPQIKLFKQNETILALFI